MIQVTTKITCDACGREIVTESSVDFRVTGASTVATKQAAKDGWTFLRDHEYCLKRTYCPACTIKGAKNIDKFLESEDE